MFWIVLGIIVVVILIVLLASYSARLTGGAITGSVITQKVSEEVDTRDLIKSGEENYGTQNISEQG